MPGHRTAQSIKQQWFPLGSPSIRAFSQEIHQLFNRCLTPEKQETTFLLLRLKGTGCISPSPKSKNFDALSVCSRGENEKDHRQGCSREGGRGRRHPNFTVCILTAAALHNLHLCLLLKPSYLLKRAQTICYQQMLPTKYKQQFSLGFLHENNISHKGNKPFQMTVNIHRKPLTTRRYL